MLTSSPTPRAPEFTSQAHKEAACPSQHMRRLPPGRACGQGGAEESRGGARKESRGGGADDRETIASTSAPAIAILELRPLIPLPRTPRSSEPLTTEKPSQLLPGC
eukprot:765549-Hanusia_phi.AAC.5